MLATKYRFHGHNSLSYVYKNGRTFRSQNITLRAIPNQRRKNSRVAVVVSKKVSKSAVRRNVIRRRIYEHVRKNELDDLPTGDFVITVFSEELALINYQELALALQSVFAAYKKTV